MLPNNRYLENNQARRMCVGCLMAYEGMGTYCGPVLCYGRQAVSSVKYLHAYEQRARLGGAVEIF